MNERARVIFEAQTHKTSNKNKMNDMIGYFVISGLLFFAMFVR